MKWTIFYAFGVLAYGTAAAGTNFEYITSKTPIAEQELAVRALISRLLPERTSEFTVVVDPSLATKPGQDVFTLETSANTLLLTGTSGVAAAWAFHHFLKYFCRAHISWNGNQLETIPKPLPLVADRLKIVAPNR